MPEQAQGVGAAPAWGDAMKADIRAKLSADAILLPTIRLALWFATAALWMQAGAVALIAARGQLLVQLIGSLATFALIGAGALTAWFASRRSWLEMRVAVGHIARFLHIAGVGR